MSVSENLALNRAAPLGRENLMTHQQNQYKLNTAPGALSESTDSSVWGLTSTQVPEALFPMHVRTRLPQEKHNSGRKPLKKICNTPLQFLSSY